MSARVPHTGCAGAWQGQHCLCKLVRAEGGSKVPGAFARAVGWNFIARKGGGGGEGREGASAMLRMHACGQVQARPHSIVLC